MDKHLVWAGTGHRRNKLGGYEPRVLDRLTDLAVAFIEHYEPRYLISGMADGWDQALALAAIRTKTEFTAAVPFPGQELVWPKKSREKYHSILSHAKLVKYIHDDRPATLDLVSQYMQDRNMWMIGHAQAVVALWNGSRGGTYNTIHSLGTTPWINLWSSWVKHR